MVKFYWTGESGKVYEFNEYVVDGPWTDAAGLYIFVRGTGTTREALYIGETGNFARRGIPSHEKLPCVQRWGGGVFVHAQVSANEQTRRTVETDLIRSYKPPCNG